MAQLYPKKMQSLIAKIAQLPGTGRKSAEKMALAIFAMESDEAQEFAQEISEIQKNVHTCIDCGFFSEDQYCRFCQDEDRDQSILCVVEQIPQVLPIEKSQSYKGLYHILAGKLSPLRRIGPDDLRIAEMIKRIEKNQVREVILSTSTDLEGETTASYIQELLSSYPQVQVSRIALGIPVGADLAYADAASMAMAINKRRHF